MTKTSWFFVAAAVLVVFGPMSATAQSKGEQVGAERLVGRWVRPDGGYVLDIRSAQAGGRLDAAYLNPRSIKISRAEWRREDGRAFDRRLLPGCTAPDLRRRIRGTEVRMLDQVAAPVARAEKRGAGTRDE